MPSSRDARPLGDLLEEFLRHPAFAPHIAHVRHTPPSPPRHAPWPEGMDPRLVEVFRARGIAEPWTHQAQAIAHALAGRHVVVVTPTASGKTLCYNAPVLNSLLRDPQARALYLFPTKALSHDQYRELHDAAAATGRDIRVFTFDGDTPPATRRALRAAGHIVVTNPDMLHCGILPHHTQWTKLFENLRYVVIDELHQYRGVFGSHLANVLRRLDRICRFHGVEPTFLASSATIANPTELARELTGRPFEAVTESGAPSGERTFVFFNPPVINAELNVRRSARLEARRIAMRFLARGHQTIVFGRSRADVEVMTTYLQRSMARLHRDPRAVCGYRGGYLPNERREIEEGVRNGRILGVVSTNALELGIDIGGLDVAILAGWPGTVASAWQQAGRAGRKARASLAIYIADSSAIDQYLMAKPEAFFAASPEQGIVNPDNPAILAAHLKCAAFELPIADGECFGATDPTPVLQHLDDARVVRHTAGRWYYSEDAYPAEDVSLRAGVEENFVVLDTGSQNRVIAEVDYPSAPQLLHDDAIYIHNGVTYYVERLDWDRRTAYVRRKAVDYYTDAQTSTNVQVLSVDQELTGEPGSLAEARRFGTVSVVTITPKFKKVKFETHEAIGYGPVNTPQLEVQTEAVWLTFREDFAAAARARGAEPGSVLRGIANLLRHAVPLHVLCDPRDFGTLAMTRAPFDQRATVYLWDRYAGGIGIARKLFAIQRQVLRACLEMLDLCPCEEGCPGCVGPRLDAGEGAKSGARWALRSLLGEA